MIKAVIFDFGGTVKHSFHRALKDIATAYGISEEKLIAVIPKYQLWRESYNDGFYVYPEINSLIRKLRQKGIKTAVLSNVIPPHVEVINKHKGYQGFDFLILSCEVGLRKPEKKNLSFGD